MECPDGAGRGWFGKKGEPFREGSELVAGLLDGGLSNGTEFVGVEGHPVDLRRRGREGSQPGDPGGSKVANVGGDAGIAPAGLEQLPS